VSFGRPEGDLKGEDKTYRSQAIFVDLEPAWCVKDRAGKRGDRGFAQRDIYRKNERRGQRKLWEKGEGKRNPTFYAKWLKNCGGLKIKRR